MAPAPTNRTSVPNVLRHDVARRRRRPARRPQVSVGSSTPVGDQQPDHHGGADRDPDQVADADQRQREAGPEQRAARPDPERRRRSRCRSPSARRAARTRRRPASRPGSARRLLRLLLARPPSEPRSDLQHLGRRHAFGVGQVGAGDQGAAQRHRVHHAEGAADDADHDRRPVREALPPADHDQAGQHEDDRRQGARRRRDRLDDVVLEDRVAAEVAQDRHRDHRGRDGGGEGQPDLEPQIDVGGGEDQRDQAAEDDAADGELAQGGAARCGHAVPRWLVPVCRVTLGVRPSRRASARSRRARPARTASGPGRPAAPAARRSSPSRPGDLGGLRVQRPVPARLVGERRGSARAPSS